MTRYSIAELERQMLDDLRDSNLTATERTCIQAVCGKEIRERAVGLAANGQLTAHTALIAERYGYRRAA